ncbi:MAG: WG repeat-containing protein [Clostridia bacterium]|nr:WG repeat-containing protein [Clostridia bacterium]
MSRTRGRRFEQEPKLNIKKVIAVLIAIAVVIMFVFIIKGILEKGEEHGRITSKSYYTAFKDNKYGVIDSDGYLVVDPSYEEMIVIPNNKKDVFLCTYDVNEETGEFKTKALNSNNDEILKGYDLIETVSNKDENDNIIIESNVLRVKKDGKYGLIDLDGKTLLNTEYEEITSLQGITNSIKTKKDGKIGIVNDEGKIILENKYADVTNLGKDDKSGFIVKNEDGKFGVVSYTGTQELEEKYDDIEKIHKNDMFVVTESGTKKLINKDGTTVLETGFNKVIEIMQNKDNGIVFEKDGKQGVMNLAGEVTIPAEYESLKEAKNGFLIAKKDGKYGIIDLKNETIIDLKYARLLYKDVADIYVLEDETANASLLNGDFEEKLKGILIEINEEKGYLKIRVGDDYKYYNFKFEEKKVEDILPSNTLYLSKKDGKYGYLDKEGNVVVDYIYDDAKEQNSCGFAAVKKDGKWGSIDSKGKVSLEPTYELQDYLEVDFIGTWHLGHDGNLSYYIK